MTPTNDQPLPDYTPEQQAEILAEMKKRFTLEDLLEYADWDGQFVPFDEVMAKAEAMLRQAEQPPTEASR